jgi:hypothetical protein
VRYYNIKLTKADGSPMPINSLKSSAIPAGNITSLITGQGGANATGTNPAALNVEFDMPQYDGNAGGASTANYIRVWGVSLQDLQKATDFNGGNLELSAGMSEGYPLATPSQRGLLVKGTIIQAFGNWLGTDMTLDFFISPLGVGSYDAPGNYTLSGKKGEKVSDVIQRALKAALPPDTPSSAKVTIEMNVRSDRVLDADENSKHDTLTEFAQKVKTLTEGRDKNTGAVNDQGVSITAAFDGVIRVSETDPARLPTRPDVKEIKFQDMLGQVTWAQPNMLTAKMVMRGDLHINQWIKFPQGLSTVTGGAFSSFGTTTRLANNLTFSGVFQITQIHHWGNYRQADAMSWNTTVWAIPTPGTGGDLGTRGTGAGGPAVPLA